ncbi:hypothetical protein [Streptomyces sp. WAC06614]|uniref:hypothetical protein n=1 Tax=Streptomyces sp. WAC06614 TaxID=2487416 RepID=UPI000F79D554|nr:hypothetical protein [Streptomyces sp. WAC06614]RSS72226.1 hypothetical protein EF918_26765 [Streptomyces sp. WAC06614]
MEIVEPFRWVFLGLAVLNAVMLVVVVRRLRPGAPQRPGRHGAPVRRAELRLDVADQGAGLVFCLGVALAGGPVAVTGGVLVAVVLAAKALREVRGSLALRRYAAAGQGPEAGWRRPRQGRGGAPVTPGWGR